MKDRITAFAGFTDEARAFEELANVGEADVRVGSSREYVSEGIMR